MQKLQHSWKAYYIRCSQNPALGSLGMTQQNIVNEMTGFADYFLECKKKGWNNPSLRSLNEGKHPGLKRRPNLIGWLHMNEKSKNKMFQTTEALHYVSTYINHMYHPLKKKKNLRTPRKINGWNLKINHLERKIIFQTIIFRFQPLIFQGVPVHPPHLWTNEKKLTFSC